jgi:cytochrome c peroxidase
MLRNVVLTAPYGHNGAFPTLEGIIRHHLDPGQSIASWNRSMAALPEAPHLSAIDFAIWDDRLEMSRQIRAIDFTPTEISAHDVKAIEAFLHSLTGEGATKGRLGIPTSVPSGLPVDQHLKR